MIYYYPLSSKDFTFENIFSSESISPPVFYKNRGFGIDYFFVIPEVNHKNAIILYNNPPQYDAQSDIKFILQIEEAYLDINSLVLISEGVFAYHKTIYLKKENFILNFFSEKDKRISILRAEISLPTKTLDKYIENFKIINESDCKKYDFDSATLEIDALNIESLIKADKKYDQFKGIVYGIVAGLFGKPAQEEMLFKHLVREIVNSFAEFKSRTAQQNLSYSTNLSDNKAKYANKIFEIIDLAENAYFDLFEDVELDENSLAKILHEKNARLESLEDAQQYINYILIDDEHFGESKFEKLKKIYAKQSNFDEKLIPFGTLRERIELFVNEAISDKKIKPNLDELNDNIKVTLYDIDRSISEISRKKDNNLSLKGLEYNFDKNEIKINNEFQYLTPEELTDMAIINNVILRYTEEISNLPQKEAILKVVKQVGILFSKGGKETLLYQYLNNEIDTYAFEKISNAVMKNFVAFIFNIESIEKLENFLNTKNIEKRWMAYSFWGAFNGFANLSGNFTKSIFSQNGELIQNYLDQYLSKYIETLKNLVLEKNTVNLTEEKQLEHIVTSQIDKVKSYYQKFVAGKYNLSKDEFRSVYSIRDKETFYKEVKTRFKMNKRNAEKLFNSIKKNFETGSLFN